MNGIPQNRFYSILIKNKISLTLAEAFANYLAQISSNCHLPNEELQRRQEHETIPLK